MPHTLDMIERSRALSESLTDEVVALRRHFHEHPELSWQEHETAARLRSVLEQEGIECRPVCKTGIVAEVGNGRGPTVAVRADMDALPLQDIKKVPYASKVEQVTHACGHDCHMSMAVGVAKVLRRLGSEWPGRVRFIFQPCEEAVPSGASELLKTGVMEGVDAVFCYHVDPEIPAGKIGLRTGVLTAHCTEFHIHLVGRSGHAARPHQAIDTIYLANQVLTLLYDIVGSRSNPFMPAVLTIGQVRGGAKANVIPDDVDIAGTVRSIDEQSNREILEAIETRTRAMTETAGGRCTVEFLPPVPSVYNHPGMIAMIRRVADKMLPKDAIVDIDKVSMGGEDFSWYLTQAPGALIRLGVRRPGEPMTHLHTSNFDVDESALTLGISLMSAVVLHYLTENAG